MVKNDKENKIEVFVIEGCPYCDGIIERLEELKLKYIKHIVNPNEKEEYKKLHKHDTFPQIFMYINKKRIKIGGYDDFDSFLYLCQLVKTTKLTFKEMKEICKLLV